MPDLETQLRNYAIGLEEQFPDILAEEIIERETPVITISRTPNLLRPRRPFLSLVAVLWLGVLLVGVVDFLRTGGRPAASEQPATSTTSQEPTDLGIFESVRGQIVFNSGESGGGPIQVVDATDPASVRNFEFDFPLEVPLIPTGWSADGSILAITDEYHGDAYVIDRTGRARKAQGVSQGCCGFAHSNWLSPDGVHAAVTYVGEGEAPGELVLTNFEDRPPNDVYELEPYAWGSGTIWSPDGAEVALVIYRNVGAYQEPTLRIVDLESGSTRDLLASEFGHIRNLAWSPDGSQILVIAGEFQNPVAPSSLNPYVNPIATSIYLLSTDGSGLRSIADGHYVAASWSPDGSQIAAIDYSGRRQVIVMSADGSNEQIVAEMPAGELFSGLAWHPVP